MGNGGDTAAVMTTRGEVGGGGNGKARWQVGLSGDGKRGDNKYYLFLALFHGGKTRWDAVRRGNFFIHLVGWGDKTGSPGDKTESLGDKPSDSVGRGDKTESLGDKTRSPGVKPSDSE
jgi:hypothetical protein